MTLGRAVSLMLLLAVGMVVFLSLISIGGLKSANQPTPTPTATQTANAATTSLYTPPI